MYLQRKQRKRTGLDGNAPKEDQTVTTVGRSRDDKLGVARFWRTRMTGGMSLGGGGIVRGELSRGECLTLDKTLILSIFGAKECIRMQDFVFKNIQQNPGVANPGPPRRNGRHLFAPTPCPPARCWCPLASSRLATALTSAKIWHLLS